MDHIMNLNDDDDNDHHIINLNDDHMMLQAFIGRKKVESLFLNSSLLSTLGPRTLAGRSWWETWLWSNITNNVLW